MFEVSPVVKGSGVDTGTIAIKSGLSLEDQIKALIAQAADITKRAGEVADLRDDKGRQFSDARLAQLVEATAGLGELIQRLTKVVPTTSAARQMARFAAITQNRSTP